MKMLIYSNTLRKVLLLLLVAGSVFAFSGFTGTIDSLYHQSQITRIDESPVCNAFAIPCTTFSCRKHISFPIPATIRGKVLTHIDRLIQVQFNRMAEIYQSFQQATIFTHIKTISFSSEEERITTLS